jgi:hypothetical protein
MLLTNRSFATYSDIQLRVEENAIQPFGSWSCLAAGN